MPHASKPKAFVIGWPIEQSKSPIIHSHWLEKHGIEGSYEKFAVAPEALKDFIMSLKDKGFVGGNVTIPHKQAILPLVDVVHPTAEQLGAANTIWFEGAKLHADNTDGYGFLANLDQQSQNWDSKKGGNALVLGAGGAARPIIYGLIERGYDTVTLVNRTRQRAEDVADLFKSLGLDDHVRVEEWEKRAELMRDINLLVNTSALGMLNQPPLELPLDKLPTTALVTDIVYNPLQTDLLKQAQQRGNPCVDGLGMLLHQAVPGFEHWFGTRPVVTDTLRQLVLSA